ncbi:hypothetical protein L2E82_40714 [Cichorium intybus]|uniref:Uncharacterized protein n=1 Tax=Cichorium intybus TaxID=13427 RepID=A0ACB9AMI3_CICIN|nr:hypothetical protein L2E82_40714 [Cichorium intybus]
MSIGNLCLVMAFFREKTQQEILGLVIGDGEKGRDAYIFVERTGPESFLVSDPNKAISLLQKICNHNSLFSLPLTKSLSAIGREGKAAIDR